MLQKPSVGAVSLGLYSPWPVKRRQYNPVHGFHPRSGKIGCLCTDTAIAVRCKAPQAAAAGQLGVPPLPAPAGAAPIRPIDQLLGARYALSGRAPERHAGIAPLLSRAATGRLAGNSKSHLHKINGVDMRTILSMTVMSVVNIGVALQCCAETAATQPARPPGASLILAPGREFAPNSYVHTPLAPDAPLDPKSPVWVAGLLQQVKDHYGTIAVGSGEYSPPVYIAAADQPTVRVVAARQWEAGWSFPPLQEQWLAVPVPGNFQPAAGTDKEAVIYQPATGRYWEFWAAEPTGRKTRNSAGRDVKEWRAGWGGRIDGLSDSPGYFKTTAEGYKFGATATGLPYLAGLITIAELRAGAINHALHFAIPTIRKGVWAAPAQRSDGAADQVDAIPEGVTFRFPANLDFDRHAAASIRPHGCQGDPAAWHGAARYRRSGGDLCGKRWQPICRRPLFWPRRHLGVPERQI